MLKLPVVIPREQVAAFCERHHVKRLSLFGSILGAEFGKGSDIDLLVEYLPDSQVTFFDMVQQEDELTELLGRRVDLRTPMELSRHFRRRVLESAQVIYERT